jgi:type II secretory pathway pseudopilin PulG
LELFIVVVIIGILATLMIPLISTLRARAQRFQCTANLRSLYVSADLFVQQNGSWPQIPRTSAGGGSEEYAKAWIDALAPFGASGKTWICPTIQGFLSNPDYSDPENARIDYIPMPFDDKPATPHQWPRAPWFVEVGDIHGSGNLIIFADGSVSDLKTVTQGAGSGQ